MKIFVSLIAALGIFWMSNLAAADLPKLIEENLHFTLKTENLMIKADAISLAGELKMDEFVIPILEVLKSSENKELRILAAIALHKINDERGLFAIKQAIHYDTERCVRRVCSNLLVLDLN